MEELLLPLCSLTFSCSTLDLLDWSSLIDRRTELSKHLVVPNMQVMPPTPFATEPRLRMLGQEGKCSLLPALGQDHCPPWPHETSVVQGKKTETVVAYRVGQRPMRRRVSGGAFHTSSRVIPNLTGLKAQHTLFSLMILDGSLSEFLS